MRHLLSLCILVLLLVSCSQKEFEFSVHNESNHDRLEDFAELSLQDIEAVVSLTDNKTYQVIDEAGNIYDSQLTYDGKLIFQPQLKANETKTFKIVNGEKKEVEPRVFGRYFPERYGDFAWENDKLGFRFYGKPLIEVQAATNGLDLWYKRTSRLVLEDWYKGDISKTASYHVDHGEGCDPYGVGTTLGAGAMAPYINNELIRNKNFDSYEVLDNGPLRITFRLIYPELKIDGKKIKDELTISLDAGSHFTKIVQDYGNTSFDVAAGLVKRPASDTVLVSDDKSYLIYAEPNSEENGQIYPTLVFPQGFEKQTIDTYKIGKDAFSHILAMTKYTGTPITYYTGFGWNKSGFSSSHDFELYTKEFSENIHLPLVITIKK